MEFLIWLAGFFLGMQFANYLHVRMIRKIAKDRGMDLDAMVSKVVESEQKTIPVLVTEKQGEVLYLYEKGTDNFICQGISMDELASKSLKYKNIPVALVEHGDKEIWFYNGEVKQKVEVV